MDTTLEQFYENVTDASFVGSGDALPSEPAYLHLANRQRILAKVRRRAAQLHQQEEHGHPCQPHGWYDRVTDYIERVNDGIEPPPPECDPNDLDAPCATPPALVERLRSAA
jgi:hypothetical protein